jgi:hypothetical protein
VEENFAPAKKAHPAFIVRDLPALSRRLEVIFPGFGGPG